MYIPCVYLFEKNRLKVQTREKVRAEWRSERLERVTPLVCWNWGKWGLKEYKLKVPFLGWFVGLVMPVKVILSCLGCSSRHSKKKIFLAVNFFNSFVPIAQLAGQAVVLGRLSLSMCLWRRYWKYLVSGYAKNWRPERREGQSGDWEASLYPLSYNVGRSDWGWGS